MSGVVKIPEGRQRWSRLLFLHWRAAPDAVRRAVPRELPLDLHDGVAWVTVVTLGIEGARPILAPETIGFDFLEANARTYVRLPGGPPAIWFFSLDADSRLAVLGARVAYGLPYLHARIRRESDDGAEVFRSVRRGARAAGVLARYRTGGPLGVASPGSLDEFLVERYVLHTMRGAGVMTVRVVHEPYPLREVDVELAEEDLLASAGIDRPDEPPLAHFSDGIDVQVRR